MKHHNFVSCSVLLLVSACDVGTSDAEPRSADSVDLVDVVLIDGELEEQVADEGACVADEGRVEFPVDLITLENGNELRFYAPDDGSSLVRESMPTLDNASFLQVVGAEMTAAEVWQLAAPQGEPMPDALLRAAARDGVDVGDGEGIGAADSLLADVGPLSVLPTWCTVDSTDFQDEFCSTDSFYTDGATCVLGSALSGGQVQSVQMPGARTRSYGGWCQHAGSSSFKIWYHSSCGSASYVEYQGSSTAAADFYVDGDIANNRFKISRVALGFSQASMGMKYTTGCSG